MGISRRMALALPLVLGAAIARTVRAQAARRVAVLLGGSASDRKDVEDELLARLASLGWKPGAIAIATGCMRMATWTRFPRWPRRSSAGSPMSSSPAARSRRSSLPAQRRRYRSSSCPFTTRSSMALCARSRGPTAMSRDPPCSTDSSCRPSASNSSARLRRQRRDCRGCGRSSSSSFPRAAARPTTCDLSSSRRRAVPASRCGSMRCVHPRICQPRSTTSLRPGAGAGRRD